MTVHVASVAVLVVALLASLGLGARWYTYGHFDPIHAAFALFFSINLLICYWEACLFLRRDHIESRTEHWRERQRETGRIPAFEFLATKVPLAQVPSPTLWADVWATYAQYDGSFADRRTFGFNVDTANGFATLVPTAILFAAYSVGFLPALVAGMIGLMLFWVWTYNTSVYLASFFIAKRHRRLSLGELAFAVVAVNSPWILFPLLGLYVSVRLVVDGDYRVMGL